MSTIVSVRVHAPPGCIEACGDTEDVMHVVMFPEGTVGGVLEELFKNVPQLQALKPDDFYLSLLSGATTLHVEFHKLVAITPVSTLLGLTRQEEDLHLVLHNVNNEPLPIPKKNTDDRNNIPLISITTNHTNGKEEEEKARSQRRKEDLQKWASELDRREQEVLIVHKAIEGMHKKMELMKNEVEQMKKKTEQIIAKERNKQRKEHAKFQEIQNVLEAKAVQLAKWEELLKERELERREGSLIPSTERGTAGKALSSSGECNIKKVDESESADEVVAKDKAVATIAPVVVVDIDSGRKGDNTDAIPQVGNGMKADNNKTKGEREENKGTNKKVGENAPGTVEALVKEASVVISGEGGTIIEGNVEELYQRSIKELARKKSRKSMWWDQQMHEQSEVLKLIHLKEASLHLPASESNLPSQSSPRRGEDHKSDDENEELEIKGEDEDMFHFEEEGGLKHSNSEQGASDDIGINSKPSRRSFMKKRSYTVAATSRSRAETQAGKRSWAKKNQIRPQNMKDIEAEYELLALQMDMKAKAPPSNSPTGGSVSSSALPVLCLDMPHDAGSGSKAKEKKRAIVGSLRKRDKEKDKTKLAPALGKEAEGVTPEEEAPPRLARRNTISEYSGDRKEDRRKGLTSPRYGGVAMKAMKNNKAKGGNKGVSAIYQELEFHKGDVVILIQAEGEMSYGEFDGKKGWFPSSSVKKLDFGGAE